MFKFLVEIKIQKFTDVQNISTIWQSKGGLGVNPEAVVI